MANKTVSVDISGPEELFDDWVDIFAKKHGWQAKFTNENGESIDNHINALQYSQGAIKKYVWSVVKNHIIEQATLDAKITTDYLAEKLLRGEQ